jgi:hypothetical protein
MPQTNVTSKHGQWVVEKPPSDIKKLEVDEEITGLYLGDENSIFKDKDTGEYLKLYRIQKRNGDEVKLPSTTDLDKWFSIREPGDFIRVKRLKNVPMPAPKKPYQKYEVAVWREQ